MDVVGALLLVVIVTAAFGSIWVFVWLESLLDRRRLLPEMPAWWYRRRRRLAVYLAVCLGLGAAVAVGGELVDDTDGEGLRYVLFGFTLAGVLVSIAVLLEELRRRRRRRRQATRAQG